MRLLSLLSLLVSHPFVQMPKPTGVMTCQPLCLRSGQVGIRVGLIRLSGAQPGVDLQGYPVSDGHQGTLVLESRFQSVVKLLRGRVLLSAGAPGAFHQDLARPRVAFGSSATLAFPGTLV